MHLQTYLEHWLSMEIFKNIQLDTKHTSGTQNFTNIHTYMFDIDISGWWRVASDVHVTW